MVYGLATFADYPWKTVAAAFLAQSRDRPFEGVQDCADRLIAWLGSMDASGGHGIALTRRGGGADSFRQYVEGFVDRYFVLTIQRSDTDEGPFPPELMELALNELEAEILQDADYVTGQIVKQTSSRVARASIGKPTDRLAKFLATHMEPSLNRALKRYFANHPDRPGAARAR